MLHWLLIAILALSLKPAPRPAITLDVSHHAALAPFVLTTTVSVSDDFVGQTCVFVEGQDVADSFSACFPSPQPRHSRETRSFRIKHGGTYEAWASTEIAPHRVVVTPRQRIFVEDSH